MEVLSEGLENITENYSTREDYSGRGMYGDTTNAIITTYPLLLISAIAEYAKTATEEELENMPEFDNLRMDKYGTGQGDLLK